MLMPSLCSCRSHCQWFRCGQPGPQEHAYKCEVFYATAGNYVSDPQKVRAVHNVVKHVLGYADAEPTHPFGECGRLWTLVALHYRMRDGPMSSSFALLLTPRPVPPPLLATVRRVAKANKPFAPSTHWLDGSPFRGLGLGRPGCERKSALNHVGEAIWSDHANWLARTLVGIPVPWDKWTFSHVAGTPEQLLGAPPAPSPQKALYLSVSKSLRVPGEKGLNRELALAPLHTLSGDDRRPHTVCATVAPGARAPDADLPLSSPSLASSASTSSLSRTPSPPRRVSSRPGLGCPRPHSIALDSAAPRVASRPPLRLHDPSAHVQITERSHVVMRSRVVTRSQVFSTGAGDHRAGQAPAPTAASLAAFFAAPAAILPAGAASPAPPLSPISFPSSPTSPASHLSLASLGSPSPTSPTAAGRPSSALEPVLRPRFFSPPPHDPQRRPPSSYRPPAHMRSHTISGRPPRPRAPQGPRGDYTLANVPIVKGNAKDFSLPAYRTTLVVRNP